MDAPTISGDQLPLAKTALAGREKSATPFTPGPWELCAHLAMPHVDEKCGCGYRGVIFGPDDDKAICQPGHEPAPQGQDGSEPGRYPREVEIANARLIAAAPDLYRALQSIVTELNHDDLMGAQCCLGPAIDALAKARGEFA